MRRIPLALGLVLILAAVFLLTQGTQILVPLAGNLGLTSHYNTEDIVLPPTLFSIPYTNYTYTSADLGSTSEVTGSLQVSNGRQVAFYVMNQGNFSLWQEHRPSAVVLAQPVAISYNFTFSPPASGEYFFIFDNQDNSPRSLIFNLSVVENVTVLSPYVQYAGFELLLVGACLTYLGLRGGRKKVAPEPAPTPKVSGWRCKFCGAVNEDYTLQFCGKCARSRE
jgi:hypothetical protein